MRTSKNLEVFHPQFWSVLLTYPTILSTVLVRLIDLSYHFVQSSGPSYWLILSFRPQFWSVLLSYPIISSTVLVRLFDLSYHFIHSSGPSYWLVLPFCPQFWSFFITYAARRECEMIPLDILLMDPRVKYAKHTHISVMHMLSIVHCVWSMSV